VARLARHAEAIARKRRAQRARRQSEARKEAARKKRSEAAKLGIFKKKRREHLEKARQADIQAGRTKRQIIARERAWHQIALLEFDGTAPRGISTAIGSFADVERTVRKIVLEGEYTEREAYELYFYSDLGLATA